MPVKAKLKNRDKGKPKGISYPTLMSADFGELVVFFYAPNKGTVVLENEEYALGYSCNSWNMEIFEPLSPDIKVVLRNAK